MAITPTFVYQRGEPIQIDLVIADAGNYDPATLTVQMAIKKAPMRTPPDKSAAPAADVAVAYTAASEQAAARWTGIVSAVQSAALAPGYYAIDAAVSQNGEVIEVTSYALINLLESVTPA